MTERVGQKPLLELRYLRMNYGINRFAIDIQLSMIKIGLIEGRDYSFEPIKISDNSFERTLNYFGAVLLQINSSNLFEFQEGILGGHYLIENFLKENKKRIKKSLENL